MGPHGISVIAHIKPGKRLLWQFRGKDGWSADVSLEHYRCQRVVPKCSRLLMILDTTEFRHQHLIQPSIAVEDWVLHGIQHVTVALQGMPTSHIESQMLALHSVQDATNA